MEPRAVTESPSALLERAAVAFAGRAERFDELPLWFTTMPDAVAQPLVEWLRDAARRMESHPHLSPEGSTMQRTALAFARQVLGESR